MRTYKKSNKKRTYRKKKQIIGRPPKRPLSAPRPYLFKRTVSEVQTLSSSNTFWSAQVNNIGKSFAWSLSSVTGETDFQNLFKYYRLKGARVRMYFSNTSSPADPAADQFANSQILVSIDRNMNGETANVADEAQYLSSQTVKRRIALGGDRKPIDLYMPLKQGALVYDTITTTNNTLTSPKWLDTSNDTTPHWGYNIMLQRVDGQPFTSGFSNRQSVRILTTLYFECKKVE